MGKIALVLAGGGGKGAYRCIFSDGRIGPMKYEERGGIRPALYQKS